MLILLLTESALCIERGDHLIFGENFMFSNVLEKISIRFEIRNDSKQYFHFVGEMCTAYLYKNKINPTKGYIFELDIVNGSNYELYTAPLDDKLYFEGFPFSINGNLMQLTKKKGDVECYGFKSLTFFEKVSELIVAVAVPSKVLYKEHRNHIELLSLLATVPLCIIIFYLKRNSLNLENNSPETKV